MTWTNLIKIIKVNRIVYQDGSIPSTLTPSCFSCLIAALESSHFDLLNWNNALSLYRLVSQALDQIIHDTDID